MAKPIMAAKTSQAARNFLSAPGAVLLLEGPAGSGKRKVGEYLLTVALELTDENPNSYPYFTLVEPDGASVSIEAIRQLQASLVRSVPGAKRFRRAVLIDRAELMTQEAQNALLKTLEEPPEDTLFMLCVDSSQNLLPTVVSRTQTLSVLPLTEAEATSAFGDTAAVRKAFLMSQGRLGLMAALVSDEAHSLLDTIAEAKEVLRKSPYERLAMVNSLAKDRLALDVLLDALRLLAHISLTTSVSSNKTVQARRWLSITRATTDAQNALRNNAGAKLVLTDLFLHL